MPDSVHLETRTHKKSCQVALGKHRWGNFEAKVPAAAAPTPNDGGPSGGGAGAGAGAGAAGRISQRAVPVAADAAAVQVSSQLRQADSTAIARRATFNNWRLAAEQGFALLVARAEFQDQGSEHEHALEFHSNNPPDYREEVE